MLFEEKLIEEVRNNEILFDLSNNGYKSTHKKRKIWQEISAKLDSDVDNCKKRWKMLRDSYKRARKSSFKLSGSGASESKGRWKHFEAMSFLDKFKDASRSIGNIGDSSSTDTVEPSVPEVIEDVWGEESLASTSTSSDTSRHKSERVREVEQSNSDFKAFLEAATSAIKVISTTQNPTRSSVEVVFLNLASKITEASLPPTVENDLELAVIQLVYSTLAQHRSTS